MSLFIWDYQTFILFGFAGFLVYVVGEASLKENNKKFFNPFLLGLAVSFSSGFVLGLFFVFPIALYLSLSKLWDILAHRRNIK